MRRWGKLKKEIAGNAVFTRFFQKKGLETLSPILFFRKKCRRRNFQPRSRAGCGGNARYRPTSIRKVEAGSRSRFTKLARE